MRRASVFFKGEAFLDLWISCVHVFLHLGELRAREASGFPPPPLTDSGPGKIFAFTFSLGGTGEGFTSSSEAVTLMESFLRAPESALGDRGGLGPGLGLLQSEALGTEGSYIPQGSLGVQGWTQA